MTDTETLTLTDFLLARIAEDEDTARACTNQSWAWADTSGRRTIADMEHVDRHSPARVLAECDAKRRIIEHFTWDDLGDEVSDPERVLAHLALPYANHPDYLDAWRP